MSIIAKSRGDSDLLVSWKDYRTQTNSLFHLIRPSHFGAFYQVALMDSYRSLQLAPGDVVLDAGANIGVFTVLAARAVGPEGFVIAIEPDAANSRWLVENCRINNLNNVAVVQKALWSSSGSWLTFEGEGLMGKLVPSNEDKKSGKKTVATISADDLLNRFGLSEVDKVKMDVEGAELSILESSHNLYQATDMVLEIHNEMNVLRIVELLSSKGFGLTHLVKGSDDFSALLRNSVKHPVLVMKVEANNRFRALRRVLKEPGPQVRKKCPQESVTLAVFTNIGNSRPVDEASSVPSSSTMSLTNGTRANSDNFLG
jgi:FkbM family methyltransferase